jgi:hypothetical protein
VPRPLLRGPRAVFRRAGAEPAVRLVGDSPAAVRQLLASSLTGGAQGVRTVSEANAVSDTSSKCVLVVDDEESKSGTWSATVQVKTARGRRGQSTPEVGLALASSQR